MASAEGDEGMWWVGEGMVGLGPGGKRSGGGEERGVRGVEERSGGREERGERPLDDSEDHLLEV